MTDSRSLIRFFVGFILTVTGVHTCPIELTPPKVVVKYGGNVSVDCSSSDSRVETMGWEASQGGKPLEEVKHLTWTASNLTEWTMTTSCYVNLLNSSIDQCQKELNIVLYTFPEIISISSRFLSSDSAFDLTEHEEHDISCHIDHVAPVRNLTVRWYKDNALIQTDTFNSSERKPVNQTSHLKYNMSRQDHGSRYRCEAHMDLRPEGPQLNKSSQEYETLVRFGPDVKCSHIELLEGETLENRCSVEGNPTPTVEWLKDGELKNLSLPLRRENAGTYDIRAEGESSVTKSVTVAVLYQPELTCPSSYTILEVALHNITCTVKGYPEPVVQWFKYGIELDTLPKRLTRGDAGQYVITATNKVSSVNVTLEITVTYSPSHILELEDAEVDAGADVSLKCASVANPRPNYSWTYYRTSNVKEQSEDGVSRLLIQNATAYNRGSYTCDAYNEHGRVSKTVTLTVRERLELICPSDYTILEFARHNITCTVKGYPEPVVQWFKEGEELDALPETLTRGDAGQYVITATNKVSSVNVTMEITVTYSPSHILELEDAEVDAGADVSLKCASVANPRPNYSWKYYRTSNVKEQSEDGVSRLLIQNATAYNRGSYTCDAYNEHGRVSKTVTLTVRGAKNECPVTIQATPESTVIQYQGESSTVECKETPSSISNAKEVFWTLTSGSSVSTTGNGTWHVDTNGHWNLIPLCIAVLDGIGRCEKSYDYTLYKIPDDVFLSSNVTAVVEGGPVELHCHIINVAPARSLEVHWYQGNGTFESQIKGPLEVTSCSFNDNTNCNISMIRSPVNVSSAISVTLNRTHRSVQFRCEVVMNLGSGGPQPPPNATSNLHTIIVLSKPIIDTESLPNTIPVFRGYPENLDCKADGHPPPVIQWSCCSGRVFNNTLTVTEAGLYNCTAANFLGSSFHVVEVVFKEDYLPLIAGFVAVTVVAISVIFLFIYSIYYKNTKMRRYSLKNPKLSNHNGNVAHNGWDMQFPMTKLS